MAKKNPKPNVIDGFASVQAVKRSGKGQAEARTRESADQLPARGSPPKKAEADSAAAQQLRIGHTALPPRHELTCYECGFEFVLTGRLTNPICARCRKTLEAQDYVIQAEWRTDIRTLGTIEVMAQGVVTGARLICQHLVLAGTISPGPGSRCQTLTLRPGTDFEPDAIDFTDLIVDSGADLSPGAGLSCRTLTLKGSLHADVSASQRITLAAGSSLRGTIRTPALTIEDSAALDADLHIIPENPDFTADPEH